MPSPVKFTTWYTIRVYIYFFWQLIPCGHSPYVPSSLRRGWVCLLWICLAFRQVYASHIQHCTTHKSSVSTGFAKQIMPLLRILCYNGSLVTWVSGRIAKKTPSSTVLLLLHVCSSLRYLLLSYYLAPGTFSGSNIPASSHCVTICSFL
jgi:hypothetical protein